MSHPAIESENRIPTGTEKLEFVAQQLLDLQPGQKPVFDCPYCLGRTRRGEVFCCETMLHAVEAILDANEQIRVLDVMERVIDRHMSN